MKREDQIALVSSLLNSIRTELVEKIDTGKVPERWDGHELREWIYDKVSYERTNIMRQKGRYRKRNREYANDCYNNNL